MLDLAMPCKEEEDEVKTGSMRQREIKRWQNVDRMSSESRSQTCLGYAESQVRKKNSNINIKPFDGGNL